MKNIWRLGVSLAALWLLVACAAPSSIRKIGLLAPFEGPRRAIGYEALYAARLALSDSGRLDLDLLAVDDGGTPNSIALQAAALAQDPQVSAVILLGDLAAEDAVREALAGRQLLFINVDNLPATLEAGMQHLQSATPPSAAFSARYAASDPFAPVPSINAPLVYATMVELIGHSPAIPR